jgi:hypothetical protein
MPKLGDGTVRNGWVLASTMGVFGRNWLLRTLVNDGGIWANTFDEVIYYKAFVGPDGAPLSGDRAYTLHFTKEQLPAQYATFFWSVIAVDAVYRRVLPNPQKRYLINKESKPQYGKDGSLTLYLADAKPEAAPDANWLPTPKGQRYSLTFRRRAWGAGAVHTHSRRRWRQCRLSGVVWRAKRRSARSWTDRHRWVEPSTLGHVLGRRTSRGAMPTQGAP